MYCTLTVVHSAGKPGSSIGQIVIDVSFSEHVFFSSAKL